MNFVRLCCTRLGISRIDGIEDVISKERLGCCGRRIEETRVLKGGNSPQEALRIKERVFRDELRGRLMSPQKRCTIKEAYVAKAESVQLVTSTGNLRKKSTNDDGIRYSFRWLSKLKRECGVEEGTIPRQPFGVHRSRSANVEYRQWSHRIEAHSIRPDKH